MSCVFCGNTDEEQILCIAHEIDCPFVHQEIERSIRVIEPLFTCQVCNESWTDQTG
jgi:hypothetical protein